MTTSSQPPLKGIRILVTRAKKQAGALSGLLGTLGADVIEVPTIEIRPPASFAELDRALASIDVYDWLILTSVNGVEALFSRMESIGLSAEALGHLRIAAIGPATQRCIEAHGLQVEVVPGNYIAEDVVSALRDQVAGKRVLLIRAKVARDVIPRELAQAGAEMDVVEGYETGLPDGSEAVLAAIFSDAERLPQLICLTSSSTAQNLLAIAPGVAGLIRGNKILCACIGPVTSKALLDRGLPVAIEAKEYTVEGLVEAITQYFADHPTSRA